MLRRKILPCDQRINSSSHRDISPLNSKKTVEPKQQAKHLERNAHKFRVNFGARWGNLVETISSGIGNIVRWNLICTRHVLGRSGGHNENVFIPLFTTGKTVRIGPGVFQRVLFVSVHKKLHR